MEAKRLLEMIAEENGVSYEAAQEIIKIEKDHVYQKSRRTRGSIKALIEKEAAKDGE